MALKTTNAGTLVNGATASGDRSIHVKMLIATHVANVGDCKKGDKVYVSHSDAQYLVGYKFAELIK